MYESMRLDIQQFDASDYLPNNPYGMPLASKKVPELMEDENNGKIMAEFIGLRAKLYSYKVHGNEFENKLAKGVRGVTLKTITFDAYKECLLHNKIMIKTHHMIRSAKHVVETVRQNKIVLSWQDDKRIMCP